MKLHKIIIYQLECKTKDNSSILTYEYYHLLKFLATLPVIFKRSVAIGRPLVSFTFHLILEGSRHQVCFSIVGCISSIFPFPLLEFVQYFIFTCILVHLTLRSFESLSISLLLQHLLFSLSMLCRCITLLARQDISGVFILRSNVIFWSFQILLNWKILFLVIPILIFMKITKLAGS